MPLPAALIPSSKVIDRPAIRAYAEVTGDFNPIHLDPDFAVRTPMKGIIAHGMLSLNMLWQALAKTLGADALAGMTGIARTARP